jgi:N-methylhydantoinase A
VTDADLLLGYLDPDNYANGYIKLNPKRSLFAIEEDLCDPLDMDPIDVARVIKDGVDEQMAIGIGKELRVRGYLPEDFTMLAYGGNGPLHACGVARHAGIKRVLAPPFSSVFSACGAGNMKQLHFHERGVHITMYNATTRSLYANYAEFNSVVQELEDAGREDLIRQGFSEEDVRYRLELDMRYGNQLLTQAVALTDLHRINGVKEVLDIIKTFGDVYSHRFGASSAAPEAGIRCSTVRVASFVDGDVVNFESLEHGGARSAPTPVGSRTAHFIGIDDPIDTPVYDQDSLRPDRVIAGPAIVTTENTTFLVEPGWRLEPTAQGAVWFLQD